MSASGVSALERGREEHKLSATLPAFGSSSVRADARIRPDAVARDSPHTA
jgi:hypothetical protein